MAHDRRIAVNEEVDVPVTGPYFMMYSADFKLPNQPVHEAMARNIALHQQADGHWTSWAPRLLLEVQPYSGDGAVDPLQLYGADYRQTVRSGTTAAGLSSER